VGAPGAYNMGIGAGIAAIGLVVTLGTMAVTGGHFAVVAYGAILVGGIQLVVGIGQFLIFNLQSPERKQLHFAKIEIRALVRSMIAIASADQVLQNSEIEMIISLVQRTVGLNLDEPTIRGIADGMLKKGYSLHDDLKSTQAQISQPMKDLMIKVGYFVAVADGNLGEDEWTRLWELASTLGTSRERFNGLIQEVTTPASKAKAT
jgi:tellurite resistance protein